MGPNCTPQNASQSHPGSAPLDRPALTGENRLEIRPANLASDTDQRAILELLDHYAQQPTGQGAPLADEVRSTLIARLRQHPTTVVFLAWADRRSPPRASDPKHRTAEKDSPHPAVPGSEAEQPRAVGLATCFVGFSTFRASPLVNLHDLVVHTDFRGQGIGGRLIDKVTEYAIANNYCAVTLEVRSDNRALNLYARKGFQGLKSEGQSDSMHFGKLVLPGSL